MLEIPDKNLEFTPSYTVYSVRKENYQEVINLFKLLNDVIKSGNIKLKLKLIQEDGMPKLHANISLFEFKTLQRLKPEIAPYITRNDEDDVFIGICSQKCLSARSQEQYLSIVNKLFDNYSKLTPASYEMKDFPTFQAFSGDVKQIEKLFTSLLSNSKGVIVGEFTHTAFAPKHVLVEQMKHLYSQGVRTLFLEHCCYDTLQDELDNFYQTKTPTKFLEIFLKDGCGGAVRNPRKQGTNNYYDVVEAAVLAGIRPVGLEKSTTQLVGYSKQDGAHGRARMVGLNVTGLEIIQKEAGEGKFIALVGCMHNSYCQGIAGFSELCGVPSLVIKDKQNEKPAYEINQLNVGIKDKTQITKYVGSFPQFDHFSHVILKV